MEESVSKDVVSVRGFDVGFWEKEDIKMVLPHCLDKCVHFAWL